MAGTTISGGNLKASITGTERIPVSGSSTPTINIDQVKAYALTTGVYPNSIIKTNLGTIISDDFNRASLGSNWTSTGGGTFAINSNKLRCSGGNNTNARFLYYSAYGTSNTETWTTTFSITAGTIDATSYGVGLKLYSPATGFDADFKINLDNSASLGKVTYSQSTYSNSTLSGLTITAGDVLNVTVGYNKGEFIVVLQNTNTGKLVTLRQQLTSTANYTRVVPGAYYFAISTWGGTHDVDNFSVTVHDPKGAEWGFLGDSITKAFSSDNLEFSWPSLISKNTGLTCVVNAGPGNHVVDINTTEVIALAPKKIFILLGTNDISTSAGSVTPYLSNLSTLVSTLTGAGYVVGSTLYFGLLPPKGSSYTTINTANAGIISAYGISAVVDFNTEFNDGSNNFRAEYSLDHLHPIGTAQYVMANLFIQKMGIPSKYSSVTSASPLVYDGNGHIAVSASLFRGYTADAQLDVLTDPTITSPAIRFTNVNISGLGGYLNYVAGSAQMTIDAKPSGGSWVAGATTASTLQLTSGASAALIMGTNTGLTVGNVFNSSEIWRIDNTQGLKIRFGSNYGSQAYIGGAGTATAFVHLAPGTTSFAQLRFAPGVAPTSPNDGDVYYIDTNDRLMFRKNTTNVEILSASAVTSEVLVTDISLTITYNGTTYKLLARA